MTHFGPEYDIPVFEPGMVGLAPKWVRLDPKLDKSGTFSDQIDFSTFGSMIPVLELVCNFSYMVIFAQLCNYLVIITLSIDQHKFSFDFLYFFKNG